MEKLDYEIYYTQIGEDHKHMAMLACWSKFSLKNKLILKTRLITLKNTFAHKAFAWKLSFIKIWVK